VADEVEISNVGGNGVASEVTLAKLLGIMEAMAKKKGINPDDVNKKLIALSNSTNKGTTAIDDASKAQKDNTTEVKNTTSALSNLGGVAGTALVSAFTATAKSVINIGEAFFAGADRLDAFTSQLPLVGSALGPVAKLFDDSFEAFQNVAGSGAAFNNSLTQLRSAAAGARMPLAEFTSMISANSDKLAAFGGTATGGAQQVVALNKALGANREGLLNMGLSYQDINEALIDYQYLQRAGNRGVKLNQQQLEAQADSAARYTKNLVTLGKLTGEDVKSQQAKIAAAQMDVAMQAKLGRMTAKEREKMDILMANTLASGGQAAVDALKREFLGMPPLTEEAALFTTQFGEQVTAIKNGLADVTDSNVSGAQMQAKGVDYMMDMINGASSTFARLEPGMNAAAAGLDGPMAEIANQLQGAGIKFTDFIDENGRVDQARLRAALETAVKEGDARDATTDALVKQREALAATREAFETSVISPLMEAVAPALLALTTYLKDLVASEEFKETMEKLKVYFGKLKDKVIVFLEAFKEDPKKAMADMFGSAMSGLASLLGDAIISLFTSPKFIGAMVIGIGALWAANKVTSAIKNGISGLFQGGAPGTGITSPTGGRNRGASGGAKAAGNAGKGIGSFIGNMGSGLMEGAAAGLKAFANPKILLGATILSGSIAIIAAGVAGATALMGLALPLFSEGLKSFADIDGANLVQVAKGIGAVGLAIAAFGAGAAVGAVGNTIANLIDLLPGKSPLEKLKEFASADLNTQNILNNAEAMVAYSDAMKGFSGGPAPSMLAAFKTGIVSLLGGETDPMAPIKAFGDLRLNTAGIIANAGAVAAYAFAIKDFPQSPQASVLGAFKSGIASLLGGETDPMAPIKAFGELKLNTKGIIDNAYALAAYAIAIKDFPTSPSADVFGAFKGAMVGLLGGETDPMAPIRAFGEMTLNTAGIIANATAIKSYADAVKDFPASPSASVFTALKDGIIGLLGGNTDPFAPMEEFGNRTFNTSGIINNSAAIAAFAEAMNSMPEVDVSKTGGLFGKIGELFTGADVMPWDHVSTFGEAKINSQAVIANALAMTNFGNALLAMPSANDIEGKGELDSGVISGLERISALTGENITSVANGMAAIVSISGLQSNLDVLKNGLDTEGVRSYTTALDNLVETLQDLNEELSKDNNGWSPGSGTNAGDVMGQISASTSGTSAGTQQLNSTMQQVLVLLEEMRDLDIKVERNTADAAMGYNIAARSPSRGG